MEAYARTGRQLAGRTVPSNVSRAYDALGRLQQLTVARETDLPPAKAHEFLYLCDLLLRAVR
jgi:hypothetical protein